MHSNSTNVCPPESWIGPIPALAVVVDGDGIIQCVSERFAKAIGKPVDACPGIEFASCFTDISALLFRQWIADNADRDANHMDLHLQDSEGQLLDVIASRQCCRCWGVDRDDTVVLLQDVTEERRLRREYDRLESVSHSVLETQRQFIARYDTDFNITYVNRAHREHIGQDYAIGTNLFDLIPESMHDMVREKIKRITTTETLVTIDEVEQDDGTIIWREWSDIALADADGEIVEYQAVGLDVTERVLMEQMVCALAQEDPLTSLGNRKAFDEALDYHIENAKLEQGQFALVFADLDHFKAINDSLGHHAGDEYLITLSQRMRDAVSETGRVFRLGGDEFAIVTDIEQAAPKLAQMIARVMTEVREPIQLGGETVYPSMSLGSAIFPNCGSSADGLRVNADAALYASKAAGRGVWRQFSPGMASGDENAAILTEQVNQSLAEERFSVCYQPIMDLETLNWAGLEAFLRWDHPTLGMLEAKDFIQQLEDSPVIVPISEWIVKQTFNDFLEFKATAPDLVLYLNAATRSLGSRRFLEFLDKTLLTSEVAAHDLGFDIDAGDVANCPRARDNVATMAMMGITFNAADFTHTDCSISTLPGLPLNRIKIKNERLGQLSHNDQQSQLRISSEIAKSLSFEMCVDTVDSDQALQTMRNWPCRFVQGNLFAGPMNADQTGQWLEKNASVASFPIGAAAE